MMRALLVAVAWADIILCAAGRAMSIVVPAICAVILWVVMKCHGR